MAKAAEFFLGLFFGENIGPKYAKKQKTALLQFSSRLGIFMALFRWIIRNVQNETMVNHTWTYTFQISVLHFPILFPIVGLSKIES